MPKIDAYIGIVYPADYSRYRFSGDPQDEAIFDITMDRIHRLSEQCTLRLNIAFVMHRQEGPPYQYRRIFSETENDIICDLAKEQGCGVCATRSSKKELLSFMRETVKFDASPQRVRTGFKRFFEEKNPSESKIYRIPFAKLRSYTGEGAGTRNDVLNFAIAQWEAMQDWLQQLEAKLATDNARKKI